METFIAQGVDRIPTLAEASEYAQVSTDSALELHYLPPLAAYYPDWTWLRFYGTLPEALRKRLWNQEIVQVGDLPATAYSCLERILISDNGFKDNEYWYEDVFHNPHTTDYVANGIPERSQILAKATNDYCILQAKPRNLRSRSFVRTLDDIAETAARRQHFESSERIEFPWQFAPFIVGSHRELDISIKIGPLTFGDVLRDPDIRRNGEPIKDPPLPEAVQKSFDVAAARHYKKIKGEGGS